jgi:hypothetical protein
LFPVTSTIEVVAAKACISPPLENRADPVRVDQNRHECRSQPTSFRNI